MNAPDLPPDFRYLSRSAEVDLTNCDREAVHHIEWAQSGAWIFVLQGVDADPASLQPAAVSENIVEIAGLDAAEFLSLPLREALGARVLSLVDEIHRHDHREPQGMDGVAFPWNDSSTFDLQVHRAGDMVLLEWSPADSSLVDLVSGFFEGTGVVGTVQDLFDRSVVFLRQRLGFDQVNLYRFDESYNGQSVAEASAESLPRYKGNWFPDTDIPLSARIVMVKRPVALTFDHGAAGVPLVRRGDLGDVEIDMSRTVHRANSRMCSVYYQNMGVTGTAVCSLMRRQRLWGFFSFWNHGRRAALGARQRRELRAFGQAFMARLEEVEQSSHRSTIAELRERRDSLLQRMTRAEDMAGALAAVESLAEAVPSGGAGMVFPDRVVLTGECPDEGFVRGLVDWLHENHRDAGIYVHRNLSSVYPPAREHRATASGLLALRLGKRSATYVLWFRGEILQEIEWAGRPQKPIDPHSEEERLLPRGSFALWVESVEGVSAPWRSFELDLAEALRDELMLVLHELANQELSKLLEQADEARRARESLLANVSHDLRTPINGILGNAEILRRETLDPGHRGMAADIVASSRLLTRLLNDLLDQARLAAGHLPLEPCDVEVPTLEGQVQSALSQRAEDAGVALQFEWRGFEGQLVEIDPERTVQVLHNLVANAIKFTPKGGVVRVRAALEQGAGEAGELRFEVADSGRGIPESQRDKVLEAFHQVEQGDHAVHGGVGLGLSIVTGLLALMNGRLEIGDTDLGGTAMRVAIPVPCKSVAVSDGEARPTVAMAQGYQSLAGYRLLVAEDNLVNQRLMKALLGRTGCEFEMVADGREAVVAARAGTFDAYVFDVQMPELDGDAALAELRAGNGPATQVPAVAVTAHASRETEARLLREGFAAFVAKPIQLDTLVSAVDRVIQDSRD